MNPRQSSQPSSGGSLPSTSSDATGSSRRRARRREKAKNRRQAARRLTMEGLEKRQLLAANPLGPIPGVDDYDGPRNIGTVSSFKYREKEAAGIIGLNDFFQDAEPVPLGNGPGQRDTVDITGTAQFRQFGSQFESDVDYYSFELKAGDILDVATIGAASTFDVYVPNENTGQASGKVWFAQGDTLDPVPSSAIYPIDSPLQTVGNGFGAQVAPFDGTYTVAVSAETAIASNYTIGLRTYRPVTESLPIGQEQILYLDFDGGSYAKDDFNLNFEEPGTPTGGRFRIPDISRTLTDAGVLVGTTSEYTQLVRGIIQTVEQQFADIGVYGANGSYDATGNPGDYGITILNSLDHPDPGSNPLVTRVLYGSANSFADITDPPLGIAQTVDVGNFDLSENVLVFVDNEVAEVEDFPTTAAFSQFDVLGLEIGATTTHEAAHTFGLYHTDGTNLVPSLIDGGGALNPQNGLGVGDDGILGTRDDIPVRFRNDYADNEGAITFGYLYSVEAISHTLATGTKGGNMTGRVFRDINGDGNGAGDPGLPGVRLFLDVNQNGVLDPSEPSSVSGADGSYTFQAAPGTYTVVALPGSSTTTSQPIQVASNQVVTNSGTNPAERTITPGSTVFVDYDFDGTRDFNEPSAVVDSNGVYLMTGVTPGAYSLLIISPGNFNPTTSSSQTVTVTNSGAVGPTFGFGQINPDVMGKKYADLNNNGQFDAGEPGVEGAYIYADLDGDNRPDLGEPFAYTDADGNYELDLPILGRPYAIREIQEPGFIRTEPNNPEGEWTVNYVGVPLGSHYNFGGLPSRDYGDAPDSYQTAISADGPSHGVLDGLTIGSLIDTESDGRPSVDALGDDLDGPFDDEDGVITNVPLRVGKTGSIDVTLTNTTGNAAYLQAWIDFNGDGQFRSEDGEQILTDATLGTGTHTIPVAVPASVNVGSDGIMDTYSRFRYSLTPGLGVGGPADTGEVEDHLIRILAESNNGDPATDDFVNVPQNASAFPIDVLANDFDLPSNPLTITNVSNSVQGVRPIIGTDPTSGKQIILYSPPGNYTGPDSFTYTVRDGRGEFATATVSANVQFGTATPIAVDDIFKIASNEKNVPLNVLDNDIASQGGLTITQHSQGTQGGRVENIPGQRGLRYTPVDGFVGSEQFSYSITDATGATSNAIVTVVLTPQSLLDDKAEFKIELLDKNNDVELLSLQSGQEFRVRVSVDDIFRDDAVATQGLASAFTDLLYTAELVTPTDKDKSDLYPFDITFGPQFTTKEPCSQVDAEGNCVFVSGDPGTPGLLNEVGSTQSIADLETVGQTPDRASFTGFAELFTVTMKATGTGLATFKTDPTEANRSETVLIDTDKILEYGEIRYGSTSIEISPAGDGFPVALDDSYPDLPFRTQPVPIPLDVLENDILGPGDTITELTLKEQPLNGNAVRVEAGAPGPAGDYFAYTPQAGFQGFDRFTYILTVNSPTFGTTVRSVAEVTMTVGEAQNIADKPVVNYKFTTVDEAGVPIPEGTEIPAGQRFGVRVDAIELTPETGQPTDRSAFAGFLDILYSSNILTTIPVNTGGDPDLFDFDVEFDPQYLLSAAVGTNDRPGLIDEFGSNQSDLGSNGLTLATVYFKGEQPGTARVTGSPADRFPFQDTLLDKNDDPVPVARIKYDSIIVNIGPSGSGEPLHNAALPQDVNDDNLVTAVDALIVINEMSRREASGESGPIDDRHFYYDVNGDGFITAVDALQVINRLNETSPAGEAIAATPLAPELEPEIDATPVERLVEDLAAGEKWVGGGDADSGSVPGQVAAAADASDEDSGDDDLLSLLADDIANQWG